MTGPKSIDISKLYTANVRALMDLREDEVASILEGSGISVKTSKTNNDQLVIDTESGQRTVDTLKEILHLRLLIDAAGSDQRLDMEEARDLLPKLGFPVKTPHMYFNSVQAYMDSRWGKVSEGLEKFSARRPLTNLLRHLETYNQGLYYQESEIARSGFSPGKFVVNHLVDIFVPDGTQDPNKVLDEATEKDLMEPGHLGDDFAQDQAVENYIHRARAIEAFKKIMNQGLESKDNTSWAYHVQDSTTSADVLKKLEESGEMTVTVRGIEYKIQGKDAAAILKENIAFEPIYDMVMTSDTAARSEKIFKFIENERSNSIGFGGGNSEQDASFWNISGNVNNHYYVMSLLEAQMREGDPQAAMQATGIRMDMEGNGGGFLDMGVSILTNGITAGNNGLSYLGITDHEKYVPFVNDWSERDKNLGVQRGIGNGLLFAAAFGGLKYWKHTRAGRAAWYERGTAAWQEAKWGGKWKGLKKAGVKWSAPILLPTYVAGTVWNKSLGRITQGLRNYIKTGVEIAKETKPGGAVAGGLSALSKNKLIRGAQFLGRNSWDLVLVGALTYHIDQWATGEASGQFSSDKFLHLQPMPIQDPAQIQWGEDPILKKYAEDRDIEIDFSDPRSRK